MAIWQYQIFIVPEEEVNSYFKGFICITEEALNEINWWKYRQFDIESFVVFKTILPRNKSWNNEIILFGDEKSNCVEVLIEENKIVELTARIDLRKDFKKFLEILCEFAIDYNCMFLGSGLKIIYPKLQLIEDDILKNSLYESYLKRFNK